jgi:hypothetical protein
MEEEREEEEMRLCLMFIHLNAAGRCFNEVMRE